MTTSDVHQTARDLRPVRDLTWQDEAKAELHLLSLNLHNMSVELSSRHPCAALILDRYAIRIDELMARVAEITTRDPDGQEEGII